MAGGINTERIEGGSNRRERGEAIGIQEKGRSYRNTRGTGWGRRIHEEWDGGIGLHEEEDGDYRNVLGKG